jgi:putative ABC transport system permease protein
VSHLAHDLRHALRRWKHRPAFAATAILTLATGIAATTAIFSVVDAVLLKPLPWRDADRLVSVYVARPHWRNTPVLAGSWNVGNLSWPIFQDLRTKSRTLSEVGTWNRIRPTLNGERNELVYGLQVSSTFLPMLGVTPYAGRLFIPEEDAAATGAVIISYEAWQRRFGGTPDVLGRRVSLNETIYSIVGVLPPRFDFLGQNAPEFLLPWGNVPASDRHAGNHFMYGVARLLPGIPLEDAVSDANPLVRGTEKPERKQARLVPLAEDQLGRSRRPLWFLLAAAGLLLLIACANVAGLLLGEAGSRRYEIGVRLALGGSRTDVARQMLIESVALAVMAIVLAVALVMWLTPLVGSLAPAQLPRIGQVAVNVRVFAFAVLVGLTTAVLFGAGPALIFARVDPASWVRGGGRGTTRARSRAHSVLVVSEVAIAVMLVTAASLFSETLLRMTSEPVGFRPENLVVTSLRVPPDTAVTAEMRVRRNDDLVSRLASLPGVDAATATSTAPFSGSYGSNSIAVEGKPSEVNAEASRHIVTDDYFRTLGIPIVKGRGFERTDVSGDFVAVVTREFERRFMDGDAVGKRFTVNKNVHRIVGVVPATKHRRYTDEAGPAFYALNRQLPGWSTGTFIVRTTTDGQSMLSAVRTVIESAEPQSSIVTLETMRDMMRRSVAEERYRAVLSVVFGATALLLAAMGLYGLIARAAAERQREIGVRLALGAQRGAVLRLVLRQALVLVFAGVLIGVPTAMSASGLVASLLYGVTPASPHTFVLAAALLGSVAVVAALLPARRAARTDPVTVLRAD